MKKNRDGTIKIIGPLPLITTVLITIYRELFGYYVPTDYALYYVCLTVSAFSIIMLFINEKI